jgi:hypothetical protein
MKEDVLEQLVDDYLQARGYFTQHNVKFRPRRDHPSFISNQDSNHSDIDVVGYNPRVEGPDRVWAVSCKSWQAGFRVRSKIDQIEKSKRAAGREAWKAFRELVQPKWTEAFVAAVKAVSGAERFTYVTAVTFVHGDRRTWEEHPTFGSAMAPNPIRLLSLSDMLSELAPELGTAVVNSQLGRTLQLMKAAGYRLELDGSARTSRS